MKYALVTGSEGFIGSHLVEGLINNGYRVRAFVHYNSLFSRGWLNGKVHSNLDFYFGDIRDYHSVFNSLTGINVVFHLASLISIPYSYDSPESYIDTNIKGAFNVLESARQITGIERVIITSTSEVYGSAQFVPMNESHPLQAQSPYSATKIAADKIAESYYKSFNTPVTIVRPFNAYGPRQSTRAIIPRIITQLMKNPKDVKLGSLYTIRDFNFVTDVVDAFLRISENSKSIGKEINISTGIGISIHELLELISNILGIEYRLTEDKSRIRPEKSEVDRLIGDSTLLREMTGWVPKYDLLSGLKETIQFYTNSEIVADEDYIK
jgi:NAD dependent epimerase/dehydratase